MKEDVDKKLIGKKITIDLPQQYIDIIDNHCAVTLLTRRKWFFDAMIDKLQKDALLTK